VGWILLCCHGCSCSALFFEFRSNPLTPFGGKGGFPPNVSYQSLYQAFLWYRSTTYQENTYRYHTKIPIQDTTLKKTYFYVKNSYVFMFYVFMFLGMLQCHNKGIHKPKILPNLPIGVPMLCLNPINVVWVHACKAGGFDVEHGTIYSRAFVK
jgi:hypothetical protein